MAKNRSALLLGDQDEVVVVVVGVVVGEEPVGTAFVLARGVANFVGGQVLVEEHFVGRVVVAELGQVGGHMGNQVLVVDHSVDPVQLGGHVVG